MQTIIQGEAKTLTFTETGETDLSSATLSLTIRGTDISKDDDDFIDDDEADGIAAVVLTDEESESMDPGTHTIVLTVEISETNIDLSFHSLKVLSG